MDNRHLDLDIKMKFYNSCVFSTLYAAECWSLTERDEYRLDAFDMRCQRKILRIAWSQHTSNKYVRSQCSQTPSENADCNCHGLDIFNVWTTTESPRDLTSGHQPMGSVDLVAQDQHGRMSSRGASEDWVLIEWSTEEAEAAA